MKFLIVDTYYPAFIRDFYGARPRLERESYETQWLAMMDECFGTADFYSRNLRTLGHEATEVVANCVPLQRSWARDRLGLRRPFEPTGALARIPRVGRRWHSRWLSRVLVAQVRALRPDVVHIQDMPGTSPALLRALRPYARLITGQIACEYSRGADFSAYDLVLSSFPHYVEQFRRQGLRSQYFRLGFESSVRQRLVPRTTHDVVFVGSVSPEHAGRVQFLERVASDVPLSWWGPGAENLAADSPLRRRHRGQVWGLPMYQTLAEARVTLNIHVDAAGPYANNMRLYEATGAGSMLLTDSKRNLGVHFEPGREVVAFDSVDHCIEQLRYYLANERERATVAASGLRRTLAEHTYRHRMEELADIVRPLLQPTKARVVVGQNEAAARVAP
jgi:hypothetical protein